MAVCRTAFMLMALTAMSIFFLTPCSAMSLVGLDHFAINVSNLQRSANWYHRVFGFNVLHKWTTTWMVGRDNIKIGLFLRPKAKPLPDIDSLLIIQHVAFLVDADKFVDAEMAVKKAGVTIEGPEDTGIAYSIFFNDPDGHLLEITTYHPASPLVTPASRLAPAQRRPQT